MYLQVTLLVVLDEFILEDFNILEGSRVELPIVLSGLQMLSV